MKKEIVLFYLLFAAVSAVTIMYTAAKIPQLHAEVPFPYEPDYEIHKDSILIGAKYLCTPKGCSPDELTP